MGYGNGSASALGINGPAMGGGSYQQTASTAPTAGLVQQALAEHEHELSELGSAILELEKRLCAVLAPMPPEPSNDAANKLSSASVSGKIADYSRAVRMLQVRVVSMLQRLEL